MAQWTIWLDQQVIHKPVTTERNVTAATLSLALDAAGTLEVDVPVAHPAYATVASLPVLGSPLWRVERDGVEVFRGRTLSRERMPIDGCVRVVAEGTLGMLNDSVVMPYDFAGSPTAYLAQLVAGHNAQVEPWKRFVAGRVSITDKGGNDYIVRGSESVETTLSELLAKTVGSSDGGHLVVRRGTRTVDWLADVAEPCDQVVRLGVNLLEMSDLADGAELVTAIYPEGADSDGARLTIAGSRTGGPGVSVRGGLLVNDALAATYGTVAREVTWDDVTTEPALWSRALAYAQALSAPRTVTVKAIDMSDAGQDVDAFDVGQVVTLDALDTQGRMQVTAIEWDLLDPAGGSITFGEASVTSSARTAEAGATATAAAYVAGGSSGGSSGGGVTGVKGAAETDYRTGNVSLTPADLGLPSLTVGALTRGSGASTWASGEARLSGNVVVVNVTNARLASALASGGNSPTIGTVPAGMRPPVVQRVPVALSVTGNYANVWAAIGAGGAVQIHNGSGLSIPATADISLSCTYVID